jgi:hypothetical protein
MNYNSQETGHTKEKAVENKQKRKPIYLFIAGQPTEKQSGQGQILFDGVWVVNGRGYLIRREAKSMVICTIDLFFFQSAPNCVIHEAWLVLMGNFLQIHL